MIRFYEASRLVADKTSGARTVLYHPSGVTVPALTGLCYMNTVMSKSFVHIGRIALGTGNHLVLLCKHL